MIKFLAEGSSWLYVLPTWTPSRIGDRTLLWKVYHIESGKILKAGFESEDDAKDWLEARHEDLEDDYTVDEMDHDEEDEWRAAQDEELEAAPVEEEEEVADDDDAFFEEEESDEESLEDMYEDEDDDDDA